MIKFTKYDLENIFEQNNVDWSDYALGLNDEDKEEYFQVYANELYESIIKINSSELIEKAKYLILEYYDFQELWNKGTVYNDGKLSEEELEMLEDGEGDEIDYEKFAWSEDKLYEYIIDNNYNDCSVSYTYVEATSKYIDRGEFVAYSLHEEVEKNSQIIFMKIKLEKDLRIGESESGKVKI